MVKKIYNIMAFCLLGSICSVRISVALTNILLFIAVIFFLYSLYLRIQYNRDCLYGNIVDFKIYYKFWGILFFSMIPSVLFSYDFSLSAKGLFDMWLYRMMPFFIITIGLNDRNILEKFLIAIFSIFSLECIVAIIQVLTGTANRGNGFSHEPTGLAAMLAMVLPMALVCILDKRINIQARKVAIFSMPFIIGGAIVGQGRALWLSLLIVCPIILFRYVLKSKKILITVGVIMCALFVLFSTSQKLSNRFKSSINITTNISNTDRIVLWKSSFNMIKDHPFTGVGIRCYQNVYREKYVLPEIKQKYLGQSHNNFVQIFSETGMLGFMGYLLFNLFILWHSFKIWWGKNNPYALMLFSIWLSFTLVGMAFASIQVSSMSKMLWFLTGLLVVLTKCLNDDI